jgi:hypothetical protein
MRLRLTLGLLAALALVATSAGTAAAAKAPTTVKLTEVVEGMAGEGLYSGKVKSPRPKCRRHRRVMVIHDVMPPFPIGETRSDQHGDWTLTGPLPPDGDTIVVKVKKTRRCKGVRRPYVVDRG